MYTTTSQRSAGPFSADEQELSLFYKPAVIPAAIKDIFYIDRIIFDLVKDNIPFLNEHPVVFVRCDIQFLKVRETLRYPA